MVGQIVGSYHVTARLGSGGMGEVFRATDTRLGREVAIKFSAAQFGERFEREARAVAALNHPNICTLYDVAPNYLVMELVEGVTLAERILEGPIPLPEALGLARQIAAAIEEAHEKGITHRDLKPSNIKIKPDGTVKVLDFGLAKMAHTGPAAQPGADSSEPDPGLTLSPTITSPAAMTHAGVILGTAPYMAPEQAKGKPVDRRADIWAFGVVLYEMLTARRPFHGNDVGDVLASVIKEEPRWDDVPVPARRLLLRCLEKDPKKRLRNISGVELLLEEEVETRPSTDRRSWRSLHWVVEGALVAGLVLTAWLLWPTTPAERPLQYFEVYLGPDVIPGTLRGADVIISPDGSRLAFVSQSRLFTRRFDQPATIELAGTERPFAPFFSPDGGWIGFFSSGLKKVAVTGGAAMTLAPGIGYGASWGDDGYIVASLDGRILTRIPAAGGTATPLTELSGDEYGHRWPQVLPGGKVVLFTARRPSGDAIMAVTVGDRKPKLLHEGGLFGRYMASSDGTGYLLFVNGNTLYATPFDVDRLSIGGTPAPVLEGISANDTLGSGFAQFDVSRTGTLVYRSSGQSGRVVTLQWVDTSDKAKSLPVKPGEYLHPRLSPDGTRLALAVASGTGQNIWVYDLARDHMLPLTFGAKATYQFPVWTPDGRYIVYTDGPSGEGMFWTRADGGGSPQPLTRNTNGQFPWSFSPDGKRLAYAEFPGGNGDLWTVPIEYDATGMKAGTPDVLLQTPANELYPAFSPDGKWIAHRSFESGQSEIYVRPFPNTGARWLVSAGGGSVPIWSPTGRELFYRTDDQRVMVVSYTQTSDSFSAGKPQLWSEIRLANSNQRNLDVSPDGKRFLAMMPVETAEAQSLRNHVAFLQNFADELRRRMGPHRP